MTREKEAPAWSAAGSYALRSIRAPDRPDLIGEEVLRGLAVREILATVRQLVENEPVTGAWGLMAMTADRSEPDALMRLLLQEGGVDFDRPDPMPACTAFPHFAARPLPGLVTGTVGYCCEHFSE